MLLRSPRQNEDKQFHLKAALIILAHTHRLVRPFLLVVIIIVIVAVAKVAGQVCVEQRDH